MNNTITEMDFEKRIALIAHDNKKQDLLEWARFNLDTLKKHKLYSTGTTGQLLEETLEIEITKLQSGPLGGDQKVGSMIADGELDLVVFFFEPLQAFGHDPDIKALMRIAAVWNIPIACTRATADFVISSPLLDKTYKRLLPDYSSHKNRLKKPVKLKKNKVKG